MKLRSAFSFWLKMRDEPRGTRVHAFESAAGCVAVRVSWGRAMRFLFA